MATNQAATWTAEIHGKAGNVVLSDGSVLQVNNKQLRKALAQTLMATNRLALP